MQKKILSNLLLILADIFALFVALFLSHLIRTWLERFEQFGPYDGNYEKFFLSGFIFILLFVIFYLSGLYTRRNDFWEETRRVWQGIVILAVLYITFIFAIKASEEYSRSLIGLLFFNLLWLLPLVRVFAKRLLHNRGLLQIDALILGEQQEVEKLEEILRLNWYLGYRSVDKLDSEGVVFIATKNMPVSRLEKLISKYKKEVSEVIVIPYLSNIGFANAEIIDLRVGQFSMINIQNQLFRPKNILLKKIVESTTVVLLTPLFLLIYIIVATVIKIDSRGSILFKQKRLGKNGRVFECYKFRTMFEDSDSILQSYLILNPDEVEHYEKYHKYKNDPRITSVGRCLRRFSLDELPQMLNVLKLQMSLIGPRPYMISEREKLGSNIDTILHVKPGITGFWQIKGRNTLSFEERIDMDVWYIQNWSLWLDFIIFAKTFEVLFTRRGAS